jgi:hypothetical protein
LVNTPGNEKSHLRKHKKPTGSAAVYGYLEGIFTEGKGSILHRIPIAIGAAMLAVAAYAAQAQGIKKETLTEDPNVTRSLEPGSTPQGTRSPDPVDNSGSQDDAASAMKNLRENPVNVEGHQVERQTREGGQPQPEESAKDVEDRAGVPDANEPAGTKGK